MDGHARPGERAHAVGHAADRSADARARRRRARPTSPATWRRSPRICCCRARTTTRASVTGALGDARRGAGRDRPRRVPRRRSTGSANRWRMRETAALIGDVDDAGLDRDPRAIVTTIGAGERRGAEAGRRWSSSDTLGVATAPPSSSSGFGPAAVAAARARSSATRAGSCSATRRAAARPDRRRPRRVPLLQPLLRQGRSARGARSDRRRSATSTDPSAARAIHTVLRSATGDAAPRGHRRARRRPRPARRADARRASSTRASRSARTTRSCSRRIDALGARRQRRRGARRSSTAHRRRGVLRRARSCGRSRSAASTRWRASARPQGDGGARATRRGPATGC